MLICKNCFSENADGATTCHHCKMEGNFLHQPSDGAANIKVVDIKPPECTNCGSEAPGEGDTCVHCHFPIAKKTERNSSSFFHDLPGNLKQANS